MNICTETPASQLATSTPSSMTGRTQRVETDVRAPRGHGLPPIVITSEQPVEGIGH